MIATKINRGCENRLYNLQRFVQNVGDYVQLSFMLMLLLLYKYNRVKKKNVYRKSTLRTVTEPPILNGHTEGHLAFREGALTRHSPVG